jgi:hypothetical protein
MHGIVTVNSFLEDHMADMQGRGAEHLISAAYHSHRLPAVGCQDPSRARAHSSDQQRFPHLTA